MLLQAQPIPWFKLLKGGAQQIRQPIPSASAPFQPQSVFTDFYCDPVNGNIMNGGSSEGTVQYASTNGNWSNPTFTPTDGSTPIDTVRPGAFCQVFLDGATTPVYYARVAQVASGVNGVITLLVSGAVAGTPPTNGATGRTIRVGGAWAGPSGSQIHPFGSNFNGTTFTDAAGHLMRINFKNNATYSMTNSLSAAGLWYQGYAVTPGDGGKATFDFGTTLTHGFNPGGAGGGSTLVDMIVTSSATSGTNIGLQNFGEGCRFIRIVVKGWWGNGINMRGGLYLECETYNCNRSNTTNGGGFVYNSSSTDLQLVRCIATGMLGSGSSGFIFGVTGSSYTIGLTCTKCISYGNTVGFSVNSNSGGANLRFIECDAINNNGDGLRITNTTINQAYFFLENCNFVGNGGWGFNTTIVPGTGHIAGYVYNCGFGKNGAGHYNNTDALIFTGPLESVGGEIVIYPNNETPYKAISTGDFTITHPAAIGTGRGKFTQTQGGYAGTRGYPAIGAATSHPYTISWNGQDVDLPLGYVNMAYAYDVVFPGAEAVTLQSGSLPPGLFLVQPTPYEWAITGTPTTVGSYSFVLRVTVGSSTGNATFNVTIDPEPSGTGTLESWGVIE